MWRNHANKHEMLNVAYLSTSHLNPAYSVNVTDFLGCAHTRRGEVNLLFEHGLAHVGVVCGQASRGKFKGIWSVWPVMLLSVGEIVCRGDMKMQLESYDVR